MESNGDGGGTPPIVAHTPEEEFTSITAAMRDGHSMAETASDDGESSTESMEDDGSMRKKFRHPASEELVKTIISYVDDLVVGPPDVPLNEGEVEDEQITRRRRRETTSTDSDSDSSVDPVPREWKELSRANDTGKFAETAVLRMSDENGTKGIGEPKRGQEDVFRNIGRWEEPLEIAQAGREKKTRDMSQGTVIGNLPPVPFDPEVDAPAHVCFQCWKPGHGWPQCPEGRRWEYCTNCGRSNVSINTCPRCAELHRAFIEEKYGERRRRRRSRRQRQEENDSSTGQAPERDRSCPRPRPALERRASPPIVPRRPVQERLGPRWMEPEQRDREERILEFFRRIQDLPRGLRIYAIREFFGTDPAPGEREWLR